MFLTFLVGAFLAFSAQDATGFDLPLLADAQRPDACGVETDPEQEVVCITTPGKSAQTTMNAYLAWLRSNRFEIVPAPEADAGFVRQGPDGPQGGLIDTVRVLDGRYPDDDTVFIVFRLLKLDVHGEPASVPETVEGDYSDR